MLKSSRSSGGFGRDLYWEYCKKIGRVCSEITSQPRQCPLQGVVGSSIAPLDDTMMEGGMLLAFGKLGSVMIYFCTICDSRT